MTDHTKKSGRVVREMAPPAPLHSLLFAALNALLFSVLSWSVYNSRLELGKRIFPYFQDDLALLLSLWLASLACCLPGVALAELLARVGRGRPARIVLYSWSAAVCALLLADTASLSMSGSHLLYFTAYVYDVMAHPELEGLAWLGGFKGLVLPMLGVVLAAIGNVALSAYLSHRLTARHRHRPPHRVGLALLLALSFSTPWIWSDYLVASMFYQHLPLPTEIPQNAVNRRFASGVRIVEMTHARELGDILVLRNFGPALSLDGWSVVTRNLTLKLSGTLEPHQEQTLRGEFDPVLGWASLRDASGKEVDRLQYTRASNGWSASLPYRRHQGNQLRVGTELLEKSLQKASSRAVPVDAKARVTSRKHLVVFLVESLRRDAITPEGAPNLTLWSQRGLKLGNHFSSANGTHLALYSVLYGRSPLFYRRDLAARVKPQLTQTLKASGYHTSYLSSATSVGWMWMERMLGLETFDDIQLGQEHRSVDQWHRWTSKDAEYAASIPTLLKAAKTPQAVLMFAMSTHYPYPFPPEWDLSQPSLGQELDTATLGWQADHQVLRNRYSNSVRYIDHLIGEMLEEIDLENTVVVITGDHGEALWDDGTASHGTQASQVQLAVPCLVLGGGIPAGEITAPTYHADLLPTVLHALEGTPVAVQGGHGVDLLAPFERDSIPAVSVVSFPPYQLNLIGLQDRIRFEIASSEWFSGRIGLGALGKGLRVTFAGELEADGLLHGSLSESFHDETWEKRLKYWAEIFQR